LKEVGGEFGNVFVCDFAFFAGWRVAEREPAHISYATGRLVAIVYYGAELVDHLLWKLDAHDFCNNGSVYVCCLDRPMFTVSPALVCVFGAPQCILLPVIQKLKYLNS
jgi:hypothetical protein